MTGRIAFIATDDQVTASHIPPLVRAAKELGLEPVVITRDRPNREAIESAGAQIVSVETGSRGLNPMRAGYAAGQLASALKTLRPNLVHCIGIRSIVLGGTAAAMAGIARRVYAIPGLGDLGARTDLRARAGRYAVRSLLKGALRTADTRFLFENEDDPAALGLTPTDAGQTTIIRGVGIDPDEFHLELPPSSPPLRVAIVSRMTWAKGIDVAVEAVRLARSRTAPIELSLFGAAESGRTWTFAMTQLRAWGDEPGITWHGPRDHVSTVWRDHHVACLPSRGGEGLPHQLLEAAARARPIVTTDVPGCRWLVRDGIEGLIVPPSDPEALAAAFEKLLADPVLVPRMGAAARARVLHDFSERDIMDQVKRLYDEILARPVGR